MNKYEKTYCNPLSLPDYTYVDTDWPFTGFFVPVTGRNQGLKEPVRNSQVKVFRSYADPDILYYEGKWYLYGSTDICYVSSDLCTWEAHPLKPHRFDIKDAPNGGEGLDLFATNYLRNWVAVGTVCFKGKIYMLPSGSNALYTAEDPLGPFVKVGDVTLPDGSYPWIPDPAFLVDGDRLYLYFGSGIETGIQGVELNPDRPWEMLSDPVRIIEFRPESEWECTGARYNDKKVGWIEGGGAIKINGRYYICYAANGTTYDTYNMGVYYSDESPISGFKPQKNGPFCEKTKGLCKGAGHGCITEGPDNTFWVFYTSVASSVHMFERRVGMDKVVVNTDGELEVITTDTPQWAPGITAPELAENSTDLYPLTFQNVAWATSAAPGRDPIYVTDESMATWWEPDEDDTARKIIVDLRAEYEICASRVIWKESEIGKVDDCGPVKYKIEVSDNYETGEWKTLLDMSQNDKDYLIDYRTFEPVSGKFVKLTILDTPKNIKIGVTSLTVFGKRI